MGREITDLMELIELAEKVSSELDRLKNSKVLIISLSAVFFIFFTCLAFVSSIYYSEVFSNPILKPLLLLIVIIVGMLTFTYFSLNIKKINKQISIESKVLDKLFNLITPYKSSLNKEMLSVTKQASIEMRLSRINFNSKENYSLPSFLFNFLRA